MDILVYLAHGLLLATYTVREMLALRVLNLGASACLACYFATLPEPLFACVCANGCYAALNAWHAARMVSRRRGTETIGQHAGAAPTSSRYEGAGS